MEPELTIFKYDESTGLFANVSMIEIKKMIHTRISQQKYELNKDKHRHKTNETVSNKTNETVVFNNVNRKEYNAMKNQLENKRKKLVGRKGTWEQYKQLLKQT